MPPQIQKRVRGSGTLCPACLVPGKRVPLRTGGAAWYVWTCPSCKATGTTTAKDPEFIVWLGIKTGPPDPGKALDGQIAKAKARVRVAWREADRNKLPISWAKVEARERELVDLVRKKNALTP